MSFKETVLPDFVIAELYPSTLSGKKTASGDFSVNTGPADKKVSRESATETIDQQEAKTIGKSQGTMLPGPENKKENQMVPVADPATVAPGSNLPYRYLGKNQKKVSVVARYAEDPYIPEEHLQFLI